jgi:hypothetical protein
MALLRRERRLAALDGLVRQGRDLRDIWPEVIGVRKREAAHTEKFVVLDPGVCIEEDLLELAVPTHQGRLMLGDLLPGDEAVEECPHLLRVSVKLGDMMTDILVRVTAVSQQLQLS